MTVHFFRDEREWADNSSISSSVACCAVGLLAGESPPLLGAGDDAPGVPGLGEALVGDVTAAFAEARASADGGN